jgi:hypothetical protein
MELAGLAKVAACGKPLSASAFMRKFRSLHVVFYLMASLIAPAGNKILN